VKLLLYSHAFPPSVGGVETIVASLARGLSQLPKSRITAPLHVTVVTQTHAGNFDDASFPCPIVRRPGIETLARLISGADVIHIAGPAMTPMFLSWLLRKPYVVEHHGYQAICPNGILLQQPQSTICTGHFQARRYRKCIKCESRDLPWLRSAIKVLLNIPRHSLAKRAARNIAVSQHVATRIALPRTSMIYHGLQPAPEASNTSPAAARAATQSSTIRFGYVGRFVPEKGIPVLLDAAQRLRLQRRDFEIVLVGDGPQRPQIEDSIQRAHAQEFVRITGFLTGDKLAAELNSLDVVVMPSIWEETAGLAAIEQMMRARLVIVSDIGGLGEVVGTAGLKFPPYDAESLANQMNEVIQASAQVTALGKTAQDRANSLFVADRMVAEHLAIYLKLA
jgi:glycosyltransferase involved in cell wall biosynthesis